MQCLKIFRKNVLTSVQADVSVDSCTVLYIVRKIPEEGDTLRKKILEAKERSLTS